MKNILFFTLGLFLFFFGPGVVSNDGNSTSENQINPEDWSTSPDTTTRPITTLPITTPTTPKPSVPTTKSTMVTTTASHPSTEATITTTSPYPPADPDLKIGTWNTSCIVARMGVKLTFMYTAKNQNAMNKTIVLNMPNNTKAEGSCGQDDQTLSIPFYSDWFFNITFRRNKSDFSVSELGLTFNMNSHYFPNISEETGDVNVVLNNLTGMSSKINSSYQCFNQKPLAFSECKLQSIGFTKLQLEAFRISSNSSKFSDPIPCAADTEINNIVPIAVGAALGGLVIIVLIAYLIGRKRSRRGYESV